jgi:16S rRNA A1518/A1519 N6-dimethyltransferase RsmA/KsgA/DIM1 with predicted DNA glycosylase/AP lyase activity
MKRIADKSQYFLRNPNVVKTLIGHTTIKKSDTVYDIGAGSGIISSVLATRVSHVVAFENEPGTLKILRENMRNYSNVEIIEKDFLNFELPAGDYKIFANIPFHLSSPILRKLTESDNSPTAIYLIVQRQFGQKLLIDGDRFTGQLGAMVAPVFATRIRRKLEKTDYFPHPAVDTLMIELLRRDQPLVSPKRMPAYRQFITDCYADPRVFAKMPQAAANIPAGLKPSQLKLAQWVTLFNSQKTY